MACYYRGKGFVIGCEDEATFGLLPLIKRGWAKVGGHPSVTISSKNECTNVFGVRSRYSFLFSFSKKKNQKAFVKFLNKVLLRWGRVCMFADNGPCHHGKIVDRFIKTHKKTFRLYYFPKYSPQVNPIEQCWKPARRALANRIIQSMPVAEYHLRKVFNDPKFMPKMFKYLSN